MGWASLTVVLLFDAANLLGIGVLGAYLAQIFDAIKVRPEFLVGERVRGEAQAAAQRRQCLWRGWQHRKVGVPLWPIQIGNPPYAGNH